jgi:TolC family type I secretion outer membrane protein
MRHYQRFFILIFSACIMTGAGFAEETLTWEDCLAEAKKNNPDLIVAVENINQQKAAKTITASALFPQVSAQANASTAKTKESGDSYSYGANGSQLVFDGFKTFNNIKAASENINAAKENYRFTSSEVRLNLRNAFINLLKAQELVRVAEEILKIRRDDFELITLRYESGLEHKGALLTAEANLAQANLELAQAKRDIEFSQRQLTQQLGRTDFKPMYVKGEFSVRDSVREKPDFEAIVKNNPSVLQALAQKNAANYGIKSAYGNFSPTLSGNAGVGRSSDHWPPDENQWNTGLSVSMPIFEGGLRIAQVSQAKSAFAQARENERSTRDTAIVSLADTWVGLQNALDTVEVRRKQLEATEVRSKIAEAQYSTGFISFDNWIIIENDLVIAKRSYLESEANALYTEASWIQAKGETLEYAD